MAAEAEVPPSEEEEVAHRERHARRALVAAYSEDEAAVTEVAVHSYSEPCVHACPPTALV